MDIKYFKIFILLTVLIVASTDAVYKVDIDKVAIITQFGKVIGTPREPGLHFKVPFIQKEHHYAVRRIYQWSGKIFKVKTLDNKDVQVSPNVNWRINEATRFYLEVKYLESAITRLEDLLSSTIANSLCFYKLSEIENNHL